VRWGLLFFCACGRVGFDATIDASWSAPTPINEIYNAAATDDDPSMTGDMLELYFLSDRSGPQLLWRSTRATVRDGWSAPAMVAELDTAAINNAKVSSDGLTIMFSSNRTPNAGMADLWLATRPDRQTAWSPPRRIDELATTGNDIEPWLMTSDALTLYYNSDRGGFSTLWTATRASVADPFANATEITELASINDYDGSPWVDAAQRYIVFHSSRGATYDLYYSTRAQASGPWDPPQLMPDLNTEAFNESDAWISPDGHTMIYTSNVGGTDDIYVTTR